MMTEPGIGWARGLGPTRGRARALSRPGPPCGAALAAQPPTMSSPAPPSSTPFARVHVTFAEPLRVDEEGPRALVIAGRTIAERLMAAETRAHEALGVEVDW